MPKGNSGIKRSNKVNNTQANVTQTSQPNRPEETVRGVPQSQIDALRGTRGHSATSYNWHTIQDDYARVGISITEAEAKEIRNAILDFSYLHDTEMRKAWKLRQAGREHDLTPLQKKELKKYDLCAEYCKVAPLLPSGKYPTIYRGIKFSTITPEYAKNLTSLKVGDMWNVDGMPTSFSTSRSVAEAFSKHQGKKGILIHMPTKGLRNTPSIKGLSYFSGEYEAMVTDYNWRIVKVDDQRTTGDGYYHIHLDKP